MNGIVFPAIVERIATRKDHTFAITLGSNELSPSQGGDLLHLSGKLAAVYISPKETISQKEMDQVDSLDPELPGKTPGQRLRAVMFLLFKQDAQGHKDFDGYYKQKMEGIIEHYKKMIV